MITCPTCGGTVLAPARSGAPRGTCHCPRGLLAEVQERLPSNRIAPDACCLEGVITKYEAIPGTDAAKARGGVALFCPTCEGRLVFVDGAWQKEVL